MSFKANLADTFASAADANPCILMVAGPSTAVGGLRKTGPGLEVPALVADVRSLMRNGVFDSSIRSRITNRKSDEVVCPVALFMPIW